MFRSWRQGGEVMLAKAVNLIFVMRQSDPFDDKIDLLLAGVGHILATTMSIQRDFSEAGYGLKRSIVLVPLAENRPVVASFRSEIGFRLRQLGNGGMEP